MNLFVRSRFKVPRLMLGLLVIAGALGGARCWAQSVDMNPPDGMAFGKDALVQLSGKSPSPGTQGVCCTDPDDNTTANWEPTSHVFGLTGDVSGNSLNTATLGTKSATVHLYYDWWCPDGTPWGNVWVASKTHSYPILNKKVDGPDQAYVGLEENYTATLDGEPYAEASNWSDGVRAYPGNGEAKSVIWYASGDYTVSANIGGSQVGQTVHVSAFDIHGPSEAFVGESVTFVADAKGNSVSLDSWSGGDTGNGAGPSYTTSWAAAGLKKVTGKFGADSISVDIMINDLTK
jgi:hypothetical protein